MSQVRRCSREDFRLQPYHVNVFSWFSRFLLTFPYSCVCEAHFCFLDGLEFDYSEIYEHLMNGMLSSQHNPPHSHILTLFPAHGSIGGGWEDEGEDEGEDEE